MQSGQRNKKIQARAEVVASIIVEAGVHSGGIQEIIVESEVVVEVEVEAVDQVEDTHAILVERHYSRDCSKKNEKCKYCGAIGHVEFTCFDKKNDAPRMQKIGVRTGQKNAFVGEVDDDEICGHGEVVVAKIFEGNVAYHDDEEKGFLFFEGSGHHSSGQKSHFKTLEDIPHEVIMHHPVGSVRVK